MENADLRSIQRRVFIAFVAFAVALLVPVVSRILS